MRSTLEELLIFLPELGDFGLDDHCAITLAGMVGKVLLMVIFGGEENGEWRQLGDDRR